MNFLIGLEESQEICKAMRERGHKAFSCDIQDCSGGKPEWHIKDDIFHVLHRPQYTLGNFIFIAHPVCRFLANSGVRWLYNKDGTKNKQRWQDMEEAALFFKALLNTNCDGLCLENPVIHCHAQKIIEMRPTQTIQPYQFGHMEVKRTCLWLKNLPLLKETNNVYAEMMKLKYSERAKVHHCAPSPERSKIRSKTFPGIAKAMAEQWG